MNVSAGIRASKVFLAIVYSVCVLFARYTLCTRHKPCTGLLESVHRPNAISHHDRTIHLGTYDVEMPRYRNYQKAIEIRS